MISKARAASPTDTSATLHMTHIISRRTDLTAADSVQTFIDGSRRSVVVLKSVAIGRGEYLPGWNWSQHAGAQTGKTSDAHIGYVISGRMMIRAADGEEVTVGPGDAFE